MECAEVVQVIKTKSTRGDGTSANPTREVVQFWDFNGNLICVNDPLSVVSKHRHSDSNGYCDESTIPTIDTSTKY